MTSKMVAFLVEAEACLELAKYVTLHPQDDDGGGGGATTDPPDEDDAAAKKRPLPSPEELQWSFRASRLLCESLLPKLGPVATKLTRRLCRIFEARAGGWYHHGCRVLLALFEAYPDQVYEGISRRDVERLVARAESDGNCRELLLELCAPGSSVAPDLDDDDEDDDEDEEAPRRMPTPAVRWRFVTEVLARLPLTTVVAKRAPRVFADLLDGLSRDRNGEILLQPLALGLVDQTFVDVLTTTTTSDGASTTTTKVDAARALLAAAHLGRRSSYEDDDDFSDFSSIGNRRGRAIPDDDVSSAVRSKFRRWVVERHIGVLRRAVVSATGILRCYLLELVVVCLAREDDDASATTMQKKAVLPADFWSALCDVFAESVGCFDALFFELVSWALKAGTLPLGPVVERVRDIALTDDAKPHAVALCGVARLAQPGLVAFPDKVLDKIKRQAQLRCFCPGAVDLLEDDLSSGNPSIDLGSPYSLDLGFSAVVAAAAKKKTTPKTRRTKKPPDPTNPRDDVDALSDP